jgi:hypothetical protein
LFELWYCQNEDFNAFAYWASLTMMSWSIIEYGKQIAAGDELGHAMDALKWGTG